MNGLGNSVFGQAAKQVGGIAKQVAKRVVQEPLEVLKNAAGQGDVAGRQENRAMETLEQGGQASQQQVQANKQDDAGQPSGFKTREDFEKYQKLSPKKDEMELVLLRKQLAKEWGVETGMEKAREEFRQKEEQRMQVEEKEEEEKKVFVEQKKKQEDAQVRAAKDVASAEKRMSVMG